MTAAFEIHGGRLRARATLLAVTVAIALVIPAGSARADTPSAVGWWTSENPGAPSEPVPVVSVPDGGGPAGLPSDVPKGGFEVANDSSSVVSYAAIGYYAYGSSVTRVVLHLAPGATDLPNSQVEACPLTGTGAFTSAFGAPLSQGPAYNCSTPVPGVENSTAGTVTFAGGKFVNNSYLSIAIVGVGTTRLVFNPPDGATIQTAAASVTSPVATLPPTAPPQPHTTAPAVAAPPAITPAVTGSALQASTAAQPSTAAPNLANPQSATARATPPPSALLAVSEPSDTIKAGSAAIGALLVLVAALVVISRNRRILHQPGTATGGDSTRLNSSE
jgi:hypothetical protein